MISYLEFVFNRRPNNLFTAGTATIFGPTNLSLLKKSPSKEIASPTHSPTSLNPMDMQLRIAILSEYCSLSRVKERVLLFTKTRFLVVRHL